MQREKKKKSRKPIVKEKIEIVRIVEEKQDEELEKILIRKTWNYTIDIREEFFPKKKIYPFSRKEGSIGIFEGSVEKEVYLTIEITIDITSVFCAKEG